MIDKIDNKCTGCYSCVNSCPKNCITMVENEEGFWFPQINCDMCVKCNVCEIHCPILNEIPINKNETDVKVYAVINNDDEVRAHSSSGGAFSLIADYVLSQGGVVFGAAFDNNFEIHHICVESLADMNKLRGSKYVQSRIGDCYTQAKHFLDSGRMVLFTGTACQTSGLMAYLGRDYENLITQDLICHGVPSPLAWRKYMELREKLERSPIKHIFFRDKRFGWHDWHIAVEHENGAEYTQNQRQDMYIMSFLRGKCSRESCYDCKFKQKVRLADFTLADFWGIETIAPSLDDDKGVSSVYANSPKAQKIIDAIRDKGEVIDVDFDLAVKYNMAMVESEHLNPQRADFLRELRNKSFDMVSGKYNDEIGIGTKIRWTARRVLGNKVYDTLRKKITRG